MMKKSFKFYLIGWALLLIIFNIIAILVPALPTLEKTTPSFWIGYTFINAAFIGQVICAGMAFKDDSIKKTFYNIPLFSISYAGLISSFIVGLICMIVPILPYWIGAIICPFIFIVNLIAIIKAKIAIELVSDIDDKIDSAASFIYDMRAESETALAKAKTEQAKAASKKVRDAFKYSDPMSNEGLANIEAEINDNFALYIKAIAEGNDDTVVSKADELIGLINERNNKCKRLK